MMYFYINGVITPVVVDDYFPCKNGFPAFANSKKGCEGEMWVCLLEKAWAKLHGSYALIEGGNSAHASVHVQGVPSKFHTSSCIKDQDKFWNRLKKCDKRKFVMIAASRVEDNGLVKNHDYSLIEIHEIIYKG